ncbi:MAG: hypothetical protein HQK77_14245 [Desulfobacterales bacterium]|nr:hypothetical protein [Desulfobacterales bacterium]
MTIKTYDPKLDGPTDGDQTSPDKAETITPRKLSKMLRKNSCLTMKLGYINHTSPESEEKP